MADYNTYRTTQSVGARQGVIDEGLRAYMNKVYGLMAVGMGVTAVAAYGISTAAVDASGQLTQLGTALYASPLKWVVMLAPLAGVLLAALLLVLALMRALLPVRAVGALAVRSRGLDVAVLLALALGIAVLSTSPNL